MLAGCGWAVEHLAFAAIKLTHVAAGERHPDHPVAVDIHAARRIAGEWRLVDFGQRSLGWIIAEIDAHDRAGEAEHRAPDASVIRIDRDAVDANRQPLVLSRIDGSFRIDVVVAL